MLAAGKKGLWICTKEENMVLCTPLASELNGHTYKSIKEI